MAYKVTAAVAIATIGGDWTKPYREGGTLVGGRPVYVYQGGILPAGTSNVEHLLAMELVEKTGEPAAEASARQSGETLAELDQAPTGEPVAPDPRDTERQAARDELAAKDGKPAMSDRKAIWVEAAVAAGLDRAEAEKVSKDDLIQALRK